MDKLSLQEVSDLVEMMGGLDTALTQITAESIGDPHLSSLWKQAAALLDAIDGLLPVPNEDEDEIIDDDDFLGEDDD